MTSLATHPRTGVALLGEPHRGLVIVYLRISRDREGRELGVDRQDDDCRPLVGFLGLADRPVEYVRENDRSASVYAKKPRPLWDDVVERVKRGEVSHIIAATMSRLTRDMTEREELLALRFLGVTVTTASGQRIYPGMSAAEVQVIRFLGVNDTAESDVISERVTKTLVQSVARGIPHGPIAYGWSRTRVRGGDIVDVLNDDEADVVREVAQRLLLGQSLGSIARDLNDREIPAPRGGQWSSTLLRKVMMRERNIGQRVHQGVVVETALDGGRGAWAPIYDDATHAAVVAHLTDPSRTPRRGAQRHLLSGLLTCGKCGSFRMYVAVTGKAQPGYTCKECRGIRRAQAPLDEFVTEVVVARLARPDALDWLAADQGQLDAARDELATLRGTLAERVDMLDAGEIGRDEYVRSSTRLRARIADAEAAVERARPLPGSVRQFLGLDTVERTRAAWDAATLDARRAVIKELLTITILPTQRRRLDPASVVFGWKASAAV